MTLTNRHPTTGVRCAVYNVNNELHPDVWDDIYAGTNTSEKAVLDDITRQTRNALEENLPIEVLRYVDLDTIAEQVMEEALVNGLQETIYENDESVYEGETDGIKWALTWLGGAPHLFVLESPYFGVGRECSPCIPGALNGGSVTMIFRDEAAAGAHASESRVLSNDYGTVYGYALPTTWLRDAND